MVSIINNKYDYNFLIELESQYTEIPECLDEFFKKIEELNKNNSKIHNNKNWVIRTKNIKSEEEIINQSILVVLNKLNDKNFDSLFDKFLEINISTLKQLEYLIDITYKKSVNEIKFMSIYVNFCKKLLNSFVEDNKEKFYFKDLLLEKSQKNFLDCINIESDIRKKNNNKYFIGCICFIGELYNQDIINNKIIYSCLLIIFQYIEKNNDKLLIELVCKLIEKTGRKLNNELPLQLEKCFDKLKMITKSSIAPREKFMIMDIFDLKKNNSFPV